MTNENQKLALSIKEILTKDNYIIPIYQRNFAWGREEIHQLIQDILETYQSSKNGTDKQYYLGTLVCFTRLDESFELIDGQQRHTVLTLINLVIQKQSEGEEKPLPMNGGPNLKFDSRKNNQEFLEDVYKKYDNRGSTKYVGVYHLKEAITIIEEELDTINKLLAGDFHRFIAFFYNNVKLFRVEVPAETDVNHYFEIMNNRGEQLEKHEILKANLMSVLDNDKQKLFAEIWDACANMGEYIYPRFRRNRLFKDKKEELIESDELFEGCELKVKNFEKLFAALKKLGMTSAENNQNGNNGENLLNISDYINYIDTDYKLESGFKQEDADINDKYRSVIDFPNFLLHVLKFHAGNENISLNDNLLLEQFKPFHRNDCGKKEFSETFIFKLLKYRLLFDKYVIKQDVSIADEEKQNWGIRSFNSEDEIENTEFEDGSYDKMRMLQTMLHYSHASNTHKNWLSTFLLSIDSDTGNEFDTLFDYAKGLFTSQEEIGFDRDLSFTYPHITAYKFYFLEYLLWNFYYEYVKGGELNGDRKNRGILVSEKLYTIIDSEKDAFSKFRFRQLNSKEHLLPQSRIDFSDEIQKKHLNSFGNLCLISARDNSSANADHPEYKRENHNNNISLKRKLMFKGYTDSKEWGSEEIKEHQNLIEEFVNEYLKVKQYEKAI